MKFNYQVWPAKNGFVSVDKFNPETGEIVKTKVTTKRLTRAEWKERGFSFNGKITARA